MIFFKSCPKCGGDVLLANDIYGIELRCFQCSFTRDTLRTVETEYDDRDAHPEPAKFKWHEVSRS